MNWHEIVVTTTHVASDAVCDMLETIGAEGVVVIDPADAREELTKPNTLNYVDDDFWDTLGESVKVKAYFSEDKAEGELVSVIKSRLVGMSEFLDVGEGEVTCSDVKDEDWATSWMKYYKPSRISDRVVIKPTWEEYSKLDNDIVVEMDPGMAFGTGLHETTRLCSKFLEKYVKDGYEVLDIGTGTGILSIISKKLGARRVVAVDIDSDSVVVAKDNFAHNDVSVECYQGVLGDVDVHEFQVVVANIIANVIIDFSKDLARYVEKGGVFIASGVIADRKDDVVDALRESGFKLEESRQDKDWVAMVFRHA